ncbi:hypothetical protein [Sphingosinicella sp. CPCC 101087]|uniref:hypothetical protein n=1 Tax=Sphingosinicella sp. CPCC 101087 TaxID=2497754 RepID=UPI00101D4A9D|nr:hypothetical protein [Sphingosinicella sp. CPCC 101087]
MGLLSDPQSTELDLRVGRQSGARISLRVTPVGLLSIAILVSAILLSTRALVGTAIREGKHKPS